jgi:type III restriction enzyme
MGRPPIGKVAMTGARSRRRARFSRSRRSAAGLRRMFRGEAVQEKVSVVGTEVGGFDVLFGKIKEFIETELFDKAVGLEDLNVLRNLSEPEATRTLVETLNEGINALTVQDRGTTVIRDTIKLSRTRPYLVKDQAYITPKKSVFNKIVGDNNYELEFASFLDGCEDIVSFVKNSQSTIFRIEYRNADGSIARRDGA